MQKAQYRNAYIDTYEHKDTGCHIAPSCLNCPLERCVLEGRLNFSARSLRWARIWRLVQAGMKVVEVARQMRVSERTVSRVKQFKGVMPMPNHPTDIEDGKGAHIHALERVHYKPYKAAIAFRKPTHIVTYPQSCPRCSAGATVDFRKRTAACQLRCGWEFGG